MVAPEAMRTAHLYVEHDLAVGVGFGPRELLPPSTPTATTRGRATPAFAKYASRSGSLKPPPSSMMAIASPAPVRFWGNE